MDEKGMTLADLTAGMAIALVIIMTGGTILLSTGRWFQSYAGISDAEQVTEYLCTLITDRLAFSYGLAAGGDGSSFAAAKYQELYFSREGRVYLNGRDLYQDEYYDGRSFQCRLAVLTEPEPLLDMEVILKNEEETALDSQKVVIRLWNLEAAGGNRKIQYLSGADSQGVIDSMNSGLYIWYKTEP